MSIQAVAWVLERSEATLADRLVLIAIANHADAYGRAWPAVAQIAKEACVDRATVFRALNTLIDIGELAMKPRPGHSSIYLFPALQGSQDATCEGSQDATGGVAGCDDRGRNLRPKPSRTIKEPRRTPEWATPTPPSNALSKAESLERVRSIKNRPQEETA